MSGTYSVSRREVISSSAGTLIDGGSNGGLAGAELRVIEVYDNGRTVDVEGIGNHRINRIPLGSAGGVVQTQLGSIIAVFNNYALMGTGRTIHSVGQIEAHNHKIYDKSVKVGGLQSIHTFEGYVIPLNIRRGLPYMSIRPYTDEEWDTLPHVIFTSEGEWDPSVLDYDLEADEDWHQSIDKLHKHPFQGIFDLMGDYSKT